MCEGKTPVGTHCQSPRDKAMKALIKNVGKPATEEGGSL